MTSAPTIGVLALQGDVREHAAALQSAGARAVPVRRATELGQVDGLVLPGGESTTIDKLLRAFDLFSPLQQAIGSGLPVFGSCAGMILLADRVLDATADQQTLGGLDVTVRRNAFGRQVDSFEEELDAPLLQAGRAEPLRAAFIRAPWVEETGPEVEIMARTGPRASPAEQGPDGRREPRASGSSPAAGRIVAVRQGRLLATAFHPEIGHDPRVHEVFVDMVRGARPEA